MRAKLWALAFMAFPRKGHHAPPHNCSEITFAGVGGVISAEEHLSIVEKAKKIDLNKIL